MLCRKSRFVKGFHGVVRLLSAVFISYPIEVSGYRGEKLLPAAHDPEGGEDDEAPGGFVQPGQRIGLEKIFEEQGHYHVHPPEDENPQRQEPGKAATDGKKDPDDQYRAGQNLNHRNYDVHCVVSAQKAEDFCGFGGMGG